MKVIHGIVALSAIVASIAIFILGIANSDLKNVAPLCLTGEAMAFIVICYSLWNMWGKSYGSDSLDEIARWHRQLRHKYKRDLHWDLNNNSRGDYIRGAKAILEADIAMFPKHWDKQIVRLMCMKSLPDRIAIASAFLTAEHERFTVDIEYLPPTIVYENGEPLPPDNIKEDNGGVFDFLLRK